MEFGDIIYFILLVFFMILGFFNDSRKKKKQQQQLEEEETVSPYSKRDQTEMPPRPPRHLPPSAKPVAKNRERPVFQSSLDQVEDYRKYDTGDSIEFDYDAGSIDDDSELSPSLRLQSASFSAPSVPTKPDSPSVPVSRRTSDGKNRGGVHPLVAGLHGSDGIESLKKGIIYSEILQRRY